jgi:hypothetical protein
MTVASEPESRSARNRLSFLIEHKIRKGRLELLLELYEPEIYGLSLLGAAKVISLDLGHSIGIQTIRTLRKKSRELKGKKGTGWERQDQSDADTPQGKGPLPAGKRPDMDAMAGFKPLDVFSEEYQRKNSMIKWARQGAS